MGLILSILLSVLVAVVVWMTVYEVSSYSSYDLKLPEKASKEGIDEDTYKRKLERYKNDLSESLKAWFLLVCLPILLATTTLLGCFYIGYRSNVATCKSYEAKVQTYTAALENENITGLEKISLVDTVAELNASILKTKETASKWYGFMIPDDLINEVELIDLSVVK